MALKRQEISCYGSPEVRSLPMDPSPTAVAPSLPSSAVSSLCHSWSDAGSYDMADRPRMSELEEIPSFRYLSPASRWISRGERQAPQRASPRPAGHREAQRDGYREGLLPPHNEEFISRSVRAVEYSSAEEFYLRLCEPELLRLCQPVLVDDGDLSISLDGLTGCRCLMLSAGKLQMASAKKDRQYWKWISREDEEEYWKMTLIPDSRFPRVAELLTALDLVINGEVNIEELSPETMYAAFFVFELSYPFGFLGRLQEASVSVDGLTTRHTVCLSPVRGQRDALLLARHLVKVPRRRGDGWKEVEMGEFFVWDGLRSAAVVRMSLDGFGENLKGGLIIHGIELRPKVKDWRIGSPPVYLGLC